MRERHVRCVAQLALPLLRATRQQVALEHASKLELARRGLLEPLLGAGMSLDLGHDARLRFMPQADEQDKGFVRIPSAQRRESVRGLTPGNLPTTPRRRPR